MDYAWQVKGGLMESLESYCFYDPKWYLKSWQGMRYYEMIMYQKAVHPNYEYTLDGVAKRYYRHLTTYRWG